MAATLLSILVFLGLFGFIYIFRRDRLFGIYYMFLFIYAFFPMVGYYYFPELSLLINAYFGEEIWYESIVFVLLSLLSILFFFSLGWKKMVLSFPFRVDISSHKRSFSSYFALVTIFFILAFQIGYLIVRPENVTWYVAQDEEFVSNNVQFAIFIFLFKLSVSINYILYFLVRMGGSVFRGALIKAIAVVSFLTFTVIAFNLGNRTDVLALFLGISVFELYRFRLKLRVVAKFLIAGLVVVVGLLIIEASRYTENNIQIDPLTSLIAKDYYAPAHILFAAVSHSVVDPLLVLASNFSNSLILMGYPYLQSVITDIFNPGVATRSAGYAFYVLTEGYLVAGMFGFLYNAFVVTFWLALWRRLSLTSNSSFNYFLLGLMGCMIVNLVRGQSSYFIKYLYTFVLPAVVIYLPLVAQSINVHFGKSCLKRKKIGIDK